nr:hypothetical protein MACL_00002727 [Theileria orientalis]
MKSVKCVRILLIVWGIFTLQRPVSCGTDGETQPTEQPESIDVDMKRMDLTKLNVETAPESPQIDKITPKANKVINSIKVDDHTLWRKLPTTECLNILKYRTTTDKIFFTLITLNNGKKFSINVLYDQKNRASPATGTVAGSSDQIRQTTSTSEQSKTEWMEGMEDLDEPMTLGESVIAKAEELLQKIEDLHSRVRERVVQGRNSEGGSRSHLDELEENCLRDSIQFLKFIKSKSTRAGPAASPREEGQTVEKAVPENANESGFKTKGAAVTLAMLATILI